MTAVVLLSGGIDSAALAAWQRPSAGLFVDYGQAPAEAERRASRQVAQDLDLAWHELTVDCSAIGAGMMSTRPSPSGAPSPEWWPFRNQLLATIAAGWAVGRGHDEVLIGTVAGDGDRHRDGSHWFVAQLDRLLAGQEGGIRYRAPAIDLSSEQLIDASGIARGTLGWTFSCHRTAVGCGTCPGCRKRAEVLGGLLPRST